MSFKIMTKKTTLLASLCLLTTSLLPGCSPDPTPLPEQNTPTISFGYWDIDSLADSTQTDSLTAYLEEKFNFNASFQSFDWSTYQEQYRVLAFTGKLPDVFTNVLISSSDSNNSALYSQMISSGYLKPLPDDLSDYPHLEKLLSDYEYLRYEDGHIYAIPHPGFTDEKLTSSDSALLVRKDWMDTLHIDVPQSLDEFISMVCAFAHDDPDGNGIDDTIGYNANIISALGKWVMLGIAPECNVFTWVECDDGLCRPNWMTEDFRNVITVYHELYQKGGLEYKSSIIALQQMKDLWDEKNDLPFEECVDVLPIFPAPDGKRYSNSSSLFWGETYISASVSDEKMKIILNLLDYLLSEEGTDLYRFGIEGTDYKLSADGTMVSLISGQNTSHYSALEIKYPSAEVWSNLAPYGMDYSDFEDTPGTELLYDSECIALASKALQDCVNNTVQIDRPYDFLIFPKDQDPYGDTAFDQFINCIIGTEDPLEVWDQTLSRMKADGLDEYVEAQNEAYNQSKNTK
ncbi:MAG TPA: extracellular solute-binding protein [Candidatus Mediterraneibacter cottocaccae]|nr:extracellular solute-binding protein [Candidatus Mediterraneibacter cottocaccae]